MADIFECTGLVERDGVVREATFTREVQEVVPIPLKARTEDGPITELVTVAMDERVIAFPDFAVDLGDVRELD